MAKKTTSAHQKALYLAYKNEDRWLKNRILRLQRHCKANPEDKQAWKALENVNVPYKRNKFKDNKKEPVKPRLKQQTPDTRMTFQEALMTAMKINLDGSLGTYNA